MGLSLLEKATRIATLAHANQIRKIENIPYITHPILVSLKLAKYGFSDTIITAGLVHDVLEDSDFPPQKLEEELGTEVLEIVKTVTENSELSWEERKTAYIEAVKTGSEGAKAVSAADKVHNLESIFVEHSLLGPQLWTKFKGSREQRIWYYEQYLKMLQDSWEHPLIQELEEVLEKVRKLA